MKINEVKTKAKYDFSKKFNFRLKSYVQKIQDNIKSIIWAAPQAFKEYLKQEQVSN